MVILDTDVLIEFSKGNKKIVDKINSINPNDLAITVFNAEEFLFGLYLRNDPDEVFMGKNILKRLKMIDYTIESAEKTAEINISLRKKRNMVSKYDSCIAGICLTNNHSLFTLNKKHFNKIKGLNLI